MLESTNRTSSSNVFGFSFSLYLNPLDALTRTDMAKIPQMRIDIDAEIALVAAQIQGAGKHLDVAGAGHGRVAAGHIVLRGDVSVSKEGRGQLGHGVGLVRDAESLAARCRRQVLGDTLKADFGRPVRVQVDGDALGAQDAGGEGGKGAAERVAGGYDFVAGVLGAGFGDGGEDVGLGFEPGYPEAGAGAAGCADCCGDDGEVQVCQPVAHAS